SSRYCSPRVLHSFPTRRSSDLNVLRPEIRRQVADGGFEGGFGHTHQVVALHRFFGAVVGQRQDCAAARLLEQRQSRARESDERADRKSTRLNSSHLGISYAVFC